MEDRERQSPMAEHQASPFSQKRTLDPSESVTGVGIVFGILGAVVGVVATMFVADTSGVAEWIACCILGALAGGSAGVVIGGMIGAVFGVFRGVTLPVSRDR